MFAVGGFLENAAVEIEPGQFAVDEALRTGGQRGSFVPLSRLGEPHRGGQSVRLAILKRDGGGLAALSHHCSLPLELQSRRPL